MDSFEKQKQNAIKLFQREGPFSPSFSHIYAYGDVDLEFVFTIKKQMEDILQKTVMSPNVGNAIRFKTSPKPILLHIHSPGGLLTITYSLIQYIQRYPIPVLSFVEGIAASAAAILVRACHYSIMAPWSYLLIHQLSLGFYGKKQELNFQKEQTDTDMKYIMELIRPPTKKMEEVWEQLLQRDLFLSARKSKEYQLCDEIMETGHWIHNRQKFLDLSQNDIPFMISNYNQFDKIPFHLDEKLMMNPLFKEKIIYLDALPFSQFVEKMHQSLINYTYSPMLLLFHASEDAKISMVQPFINIILGSKKPIVALNTSIVSDFYLLSYIVCPYRIMYPRSYFILDFSQPLMGSERVEDMKENMKTTQQWVMNLLKTYTKLPKSILDKIFEKKFLLKPKDCLKYGICDQLYDHLPTSNKDKSSKKK